MRIALLVALLAAPAEKTSQKVPAVFGVAWGASTKDAQSKLGKAKSELAVAGKQPIKDLKFPRDDGGTITLSFHDGHLYWAHLELPPLKTTKEATDAAAAATNELGALPIVEMMKDGTWKPQKAPASAEVTTRRFTDGVVEVFTTVVKEDDGTWKPAVEYRHRPRWDLAGGHPDETDRELDALTKDP